MISDTLDGVSVALDDSQATAVKGHACVEITIPECSGLARRGEPVVVGVPLPQGAALDTDGFCLRDCQTGKCLPFQANAQAHWPDGSVKWLAVTFLVTVGPTEIAQLELHNGKREPVAQDKDHQAADWLLIGRQSIETPSYAPCRPGIALSDCVHGHELKCGDSSFGLPRRGTQLVTSARIHGRDLLGNGGIRLECLNRRGQPRKVLIESIDIESAGPIRCDLCFAGRLRRCAGLRLTGKLSVFSASGLVRIETTLQNPARAKHARGHWDLGDPGSVLLKAWRLSLDLSALRPQSLAWTESDFSQVRRTENLQWRICQFSSGGDNWNSRNHTNRHNTMPLRMRGYRIDMPDGQSEGMRASPVVSIQGAAGTVTCALSEFWEKFPSAIACDGKHLTVDFWPDDFGDLHELQAGEHCTRVVWLRFDADARCELHDLAWVHDPLVAQVDPDWLSVSKAIPWLPDQTAPRRPEMLSLLKEALDGPRGFFAKRDAIDEFGWRNFGDVWADHEEAYYHGPKPIISHYNNQYDLLYGLLIQFLLTGDRRWWQLADPLARHVMDIDVYHTSRDKAAYSGGLFWHTAHYLDAITSSHRTYSRRMNGPSGGPANEHAYSAGLLLYYCLTGDRRAKNTVLQLADWLMAMDDGTQHILGLLSDAPTGRVSCTTQPDYQGPGRGAGNAIGVMLDAWLASGEQRYIGFAEELIRRTVHPQDDIASRDLNNFEQRWSYTVYLQHLARYLHFTEGIDRPNGIREYVVRSLLHYADWMIDNDLFYLDYPEQLEYPTETWAAQELRKGNILFMASQWSDTLQGDRLRRRGIEMMNRAWNSLTGFESRCCTRPIALALQQSYIECYFCGAAKQADRMNRAIEYSALQHPPFVSQKQQIRNAARSPLGAVAAGLRMLRPKQWMNVGKRSWLAERARRLIAGR
jgi:hypothetical protein